MATTLEQQTHIITSYFEVIWGEKDLSRMDEFFNQNAHFHSSIAELTGIDAIKKHFENFQKLMPDVEVETLSTIAQNDTIAIVSRITGTCAKNFYGFTTNQKKVEFEEVSVCRLQNNKIQEYKVFMDLYDLLAQADAIPKTLQKVTK